jgi:translation initiation factor 3 subunit L
MYACCLFGLLQINKQNDQMFVLLTVCLVLHPICIDETIYSQLREKYTDRMLKMQKGYGIM